MRKILLLAFLAYLFTNSANAQTIGNPVIDVILSGYSVRTYSTTPVTDEQLDLILKCGVKAPSAVNAQPWKFIVVKNADLQKQVMATVSAGNVLIVVCGAEPKQPGSGPEFDCGLAVENMVIAAQGLGLGARIYGSPVNTINTARREALGIPEGYKAVTVLRIGNKDNTVDAVSAASTRKKPEEVIIYK